MVGTLNRTPTRPAAVSLDDALSRAEAGDDLSRDDLIAVLSDLKKAKPAAAKGVYVRKVTLSTTMGPGVTIDHNAIDF